MTSAMRPCRECARHVKIDETKCPFCGADLGIFHVLPVMPTISSNDDERMAPKYGGPPYVAPVLGTVILGLALAGAALYFWFW